MAFLSPRSTLSLCLASVGGPGGEKAPRKSINRCSDFCEKYGGHRKTLPCGGQNFLISEP